MNVEQTWCFFPLSCSFPWVQFQSFLNLRPWSLITETAKTRAYIALSDIALVSSIDSNPVKV